MTRSHSLLPVLPRKEVEHPFRGLLASQLECLDCQYRHPVRYDLFDSLSLCFPKQAWVSPLHLALIILCIILPVLPRKEEEHPFGGLLASHLECLDCQYRHPVRYDLSLSFPKQALVSLFQGQVEIAYLIFKYTNYHENMSVSCIPP